MFVLFTLLYVFYSHLTHCEFAFKYVWHFSTIYLNFPWKWECNVTMKSSLIGMHLKTMLKFKNVLGLYQHFQAFLVNTETSENAKITVHAKHNKSSLNNTERSDIIKFTSHFSGTIISKITHYWHIQVALKCHSMYGLKRIF